MTTKKSHLEILKFQDETNWISHYSQFQHVLNDIKIDDISVRNSALYVHSKIVSKTPSDLTSLSCFKKASIAKAESITNFSISTHDLLSKLQTKYFIKKNSSEFYRAKVYKPSINAEAENQIASYYQEFNTFPQDEVLSEIRKIVVYLSENMGNATCSLMQQICDLSQVNEIFLGLIFMPHILQYVGFVRFWSYVFPFFLQTQGNVQLFVLELKDKFFLDANKMPRHLSPINFIIRNKWSIFTGVSLSSFLFHHANPLFSLIEPMFNSTSKIFYQAEPVFSWMKPRFNSTYNALFKQLPWYEKFLKNIKVDLSLNLDIKWKGK